MEHVRRFARDGTVPVLLEGEIGTGKTTLARALHELSPRCDAAFEHVVLSTLDDTLASSELLGHVPGAFTDARRARDGRFRSAHGGSVFLDEIGKSSLAIQNKLLHAIEYGVVRPVGADRDVRVDVRVIAASNIPLAELVASGAILPDLHARIGTFSIRVPPLRERRADIAPLARHYIAVHAEGCGYSSQPEIDRDLLDALINAPWPYNLRELDSTIRRLLIEADGAAVLTLKHCEGPLEHLVPERCTDKQVTLEELDAALARANNNVARAALEMGMHRATFYRKREALMRVSQADETATR